MAPRQNENANAGENGRLLGDDNAPINTANDVSENMETTIYRHVNVSIDFLLESEKAFKAEGRDFRLRTLFDPRFENDEVARAYLARLKKKGLEVVPTCDKTNKAGVCQGHEQRIGS